MDSAGQLSSDSGNSIMGFINLFTQNLNNGYARRLKKSTPRVYINEKNDRVSNAQSSFESNTLTIKMVTLANQIYTVLDTDDEILSISNK